MSRRRRQIASGQGWISASPSDLRSVLGALTSDQPETVVSGEGKVRVHKLPPFPPRPEVQRTNASGKLDVRPMGRVKP